MMRRLYLFDFDGTLTSADTLLCFIHYACGKWRFVLGFALFSPILVLMKLHRMPTGEPSSTSFHGISAE